MDPNATLAEIRALIAEWQADDDGEVRAQYLAEQLTQRVQALDKWITRGGSLPAAWGPRGG